MGDPYPYNYSNYQQYSFPSNYNPNYASYDSNYASYNYNSHYPPYDPNYASYNYNYSSAEQWSQWNGSYPMMPPYPPPADFSVPPPPISYPSHSQNPQYNKTSPKANDYQKELENYKQTKVNNEKPTRKSRSSSPRKRSRSKSRSQSPYPYKRHSRSKSKSSRFSPRSDRLKKPTKERQMILSKWRKNYCASREEVNNRIQELAKMDQEEALEKEKSIWTRSTPSDLYYIKDDTNSKVTRGTPKLHQVCRKFEDMLVQRAHKVNNSKPRYVPPPRKNRARLCKHKSEESTSGSSDEQLTDEEDCTMEELQRKQQHPDRLHPEMWYNDPGEMNDGPLCRCSVKSRKSGIRHGIYPGEKQLLKCLPDSNNADKLYHYRITISPPTNFLIKAPTIIHYDEHEFIFEGFSMFSHFPLVQLPPCKVIRFNIEYTILYIEEKIPDNFTVKELDLFYEYLFKEVLELVDLDFKAAGDSEGCSQFHFMPRFARGLPDNGKEILAMKEVLQYLLESSFPLIEKEYLGDMIKMSQYDWQSYADEIKGMVVTYPGKKPCSVRVDQLDRNIDLQKAGYYKFPEIVHFGIRPPQLSYAGNPE